MDDPGEEAGVDFGVVGVLAVDCEEVAGSGVGVAERVVGLVEQGGALRGLGGIGAGAAAGVFVGVPLALERLEAGGEDVRIEVEVLGHAKDPEEVRESESGMIACCYAAEHYWISQMVI